MPLELEGVKKKTPTRHANEPKQEGTSGITLNATPKIARKNQTLKQTPKRTRKSRQDIALEQKPEKNQDAALGGKKDGNKMLAALMFDHTGIMETFAFAGRWWHQNAMKENADVNQYFDIRFSPNGKGIMNVGVQMGVENYFDAASYYEQNISNINHLAVPIDFEKPLDELIKGDDKVEINGRQWLVAFNHKKEDGWGAREIGLMRCGLFTYLSGGQNASAPNGWNIQNLTNGGNKKARIEVRDELGNLVGTGEIGVDENYIFTDIKSGKNLKVHLFYHHEPSGQIQIGTVKEEVVFADNMRLNKAAADDPFLKTWYTAFSLDSIGEPVIQELNKNIGMKNNRLIVYCDDVQTYLGGETRLKSDDSIPLPDFLHARVNLSQVNNQKERFGFNINGVSSYGCSMNSQDIHDFGLTADSIRVNPTDNLFVFTAYNDYSVYIGTKYLGAGDRERSIYGNADATATIALISGFDEVFTQRAYPTLKKIVDDSNGKVNLLNVPFVLPSKESGRLAAEACELAEGYGKYWEMFDKIMQTPVPWDADALARLNNAVGLAQLAKDLGINENEFKTRLQRREMESRVKEWQALAKSKGVEGLPTTIIGERIKGAEMSEESNLVLGDLKVGALQYDEFDAAITHVLNPNVAVRDWGVVNYMPDQQRFMIHLYGTSTHRLVRPDQTEVLAHDAGRKTVAEVSPTGNDVIAFREIARLPSDVLTPGAGLDWVGARFKKDGNELKFDTYSDGTGKVFAQQVGATGSSEFSGQVETDRGSRMNVGSYNAYFDFNIGGDSRFNVDFNLDPIMRWSYKLGPYMTKTYDFEITKGETRDGSKNVKFPTLAVLQSPNNDKFADAQAELHVLSMDGSYFDWSDSSGRFGNKPTGIAYRVVPKTAWVEDESSVPVFGPELLLKKKDDTLKRWELLDTKSGTTYVFKNGYDVRKMENDREVALDATDKLYGLSVWIGGRWQMSPDGGPEALWFEPSNRPERFFTTEPAQSISNVPGAKLGLKQDEPTLGMGLSVVSKKDFGPLGQKDAIQIDLNKLTGCRIKHNLGGDYGIQFDVGDLDELYYVPVFESGQWTDRYQIICKEKGFGYTSWADLSGTKGIHSAGESFLEITKPGSAEPVLISHRTADGGIPFLVVAEPSDDFSTYKSGEPQLVNETLIDIGGQNALSGDLGLAANNYRHIQSVYELNGTSLNRSEMEDAGFNPTLDNTFSGTKVKRTSDQRLDFSFYENDKHPTKFDYQETYEPAEKLIAQPLTAPLEYTTGGTKLGYNNYKDQPWLTYPVYVRMASEYSDKFQPNVLKAEFDLFSPKGARFNPNSGTISSTVLGAAYNLALQNEPPQRSMAFLFDESHRLLQQPPAITDFVPLPSNSKRKEEWGTKMYGVLGSAELETQKLLDSISDEGTKAELRDRIFSTTFKAWAVQDNKNIYLLIDGLPVLKMKDFAIVDPKEAFDDDPLCRYLVALGEGQDMRDITKNGLDKSKPALWLIPEELFGKTYAPGDKMVFPGGPAFTLNERPRDEMKVEIVEKRFAGMDKPEKMYHFTSGNMGGEKQTMVIDTYTRLSGRFELEEAYLWPKKNGPAIGLSDGVLFDGAGNRLHDYASESGYFLIYRPPGSGPESINLDFNPKADADQFEFIHREGNFTVGSQGLWLYNNAIMPFNALKTPGTGDREYTYNSLLDLGSASFSGRESTGLLNYVTYDKQTPALDNPFFTENGTRIEPLGPVGNRQGASIQYHANSGYPVFWSKQENFTAYQEGDPMGGWKRIPTMTSFVSVSPKPVSTHGKLTIKLQNGIPGMMPGTPGIVDISIYDLEAKRVGYLTMESIFAGSEQSFTFDMEKLGLMPGYYSFVLSAANNPMYESRLAKVLVTE